MSPRRRTALDHLRQARRLRPYRDDLVLAAYAVRFGYQNKCDAAGFNKDTGIPVGGLEFIRGRTHVWETARGWRVADLIDGMFTKPTDSQFHTMLKDALDAGVRS